LKKTILDWTEGRGNEVIAFARDLIRSQVLTDRAMRLGSSIMLRMKNELTDHYDSHSLHEWSSGSQSIYRRKDCLSFLCEPLPIADNRHATAFERT
jgi:hypothetical protein